MKAQSSSAEIQRTSRRLGRFLGVLCGLLAALLMLERFGALAMQAWLHGTGHNLPTRFVFQTIAAVPEVLYLLALWWVRRTLQGFAEGQFYGLAVPRMLNRVGTLLACGAFLNVFVVPGVSSGIGYAPGYLIAYDVSGLVLGALGLSLKVIAHVLRRAAAIQAELDEIF